MSVNKIILLGRVGKDPEVRDLGSNTKVASFSLATSESYKNKDGEWVEQTEWHSLQVFGKLAEYCGEKIRKGDQIYAEGQLRTRSYDASNGEKKYVTEVRVERLQKVYTSTPQTQASAPQPQAKPQPQRMEPRGNCFDPEPDDLPF